MYYCAMVLVAGSEMRASQVGVVEGEQAGAREGKVTRQEPAWQLSHSPLNLFPRRTSPISFQLSRSIFEKFEKYFSSFYDL